MGIELLAFGEEEGAQANPSSGESSVVEGEAFVRENSSSDIPGVYVLDDELKEARDSGDVRRHSLLVWLSNLQKAANDSPVKPPPGFIIMHRDILEGVWRWQRLVPYSHVEWADYKRYLVDYFIHNAAEVAALCANGQPYQGGRGIDSGCSDLQAVAELFLDVENGFIRMCSAVLTPECVSLSHEIEEHAKHMIQANGESSTAASSLVYITKEAELICKLLDCQFDTTEMINFSNIVRRSAFNLMFYKGSESYAVAGAMLGIVKEAKFVRYQLTQVNPHACMDYHLCRLIRQNTATVLTILQEELACQTHRNGDGNDTPFDRASTVTDLDCGGSDSMEKTLQASELLKSRSEEMANVAREALMRINNGESLSQEEMKS